MPDLFKTLLRVTAPTLAGAAATVALAQTAPSPVVQGAPVEVLATRLTTTTASPTTVLPLDTAGDNAPVEFALPQLANEFAGFTVGNNQGRSFTDTYSIRGLTNTPIFGAPAITIYLDDLPLGSTFTFPSDLTGFAQAELLRGPGAGTRFGRSGPGGILLLSTPPVADRTTSSLTVAVGDHGLIAGTATVATPAGQAADAFVAATYRERDGYVRNTTLNQDVDPSETRSALARVRVDATERLELTFLLNALQARDGAQAFVPLGGPFHTVSRSAEGVTELDTLNAALTAAYTSNVGRLTATTGYSRWDMGPYFNTLDFGFAELGNGSTLLQRNLSEEIIFTSDSDVSDTAWRLGLFFNDGRTNGSFTRDFGGFTFEESRYQFDTREFTLFGETTFEPIDRLEATVGLRVVDTDMRSVRTEIIPVPQVTPATHASDAVLPHLNLRYTLDAGTTLFANFSQGHKPGGFSAFTGNAALAPYDDERTRAYEGGIAHATADGRYSVVLRGYAYDIDNYQIERSFATGATADDYLVVNARRAQSRGGELELNWHPLEGLRLAASAGLTDTTLEDFVDPYTNQVFDGNQVPFVPAHDLSFRADYTSASGFYAGLRVANLGKTYYTEAEDDFFAQGSYTLVAAKLGYATDRYRIGIAGSNLTDEDYYSAITPGTFHGTPGAPRAYWVEATFHF